MMKISCTGCKKVLPVAEEHAGKWIRCRGCGTAVQAVAAEPELGLAPPPDDLGGSAVRRMDKREFKNRNRKKGDSLAGASGLHLDGGSSGSMAGGSAAGASGSFAGMSGSFAGLDLSGPATPDSQSQLWELKELNRQKAEGSITKAQYRDRKAEIMAGRSLAVQAMSRSADGMAPRAKKASGREAPVLPGPIRALLVLAVLGLGGWVAWNVFFNGDPDAAPGGSTEVAVADPAVVGTPETVGTPPPIQPGGAAGGAAVGSIPPSVAPGDPQDDPSGDTGDPTLLAGVTGGPGANPAASGVDPSASAGELPGGDGSAEVDGAPEGDEADPQVAIGGIGEGDEAGVVTPDPPAPAQARAVEWSVPWPDAAVDQTTAIGRACPIAKEMVVGDENAIIGVAGGPEATDLNDPTYAAYRDEMHRILTDLAIEEGVYNDLVIKTSDRPKRMGSLVCDRYYVEHRYRRGLVAMILTGVQDGYCVSYWFSGSQRIVPKFFDLVGSAALEPVKSDL